MSAKKTYFLNVQEGVDVHNNGWEENTTLYLRALGIKGAEINTSGDIPTLSIPKTIVVSNDFLRGVSGIIAVVDVDDE